MINQVASLKFKKIGQDVMIWPLAKIVSPETISIGDSVIIDDFVFFSGGPKTEIGSFVHIAGFTSIGGGGEFVMEDFSGLSGGVHVYTGKEDWSGDSLINPAVPSPYRVPLRTYVHIRKHAIVGAHSVILPDVEIGEGAVIGANSFVKRDCKPWTVYGGSPAAELRPRPQGHLLELESRLRKELYDTNGRYVPMAKRGSAGHQPPKREA